MFTVANVKITELTALTNPASSDVLPIVDVGADTTKKVTIADLLENAGDGSAANPAFSFDSDKNTGIYRPGADQLAISTGGTGRLFIDSNGRVGIGASTPGNTLHLAGPSGVGTRVQNTTNNLDVYLTFEGTEFRNNISGTGSFTWYTGGGEKLRIANNGNVGIGEATPSQNLTVNAASATFALTSPGGATTFLIGNRDSLGTNNPNIITAANGNLYFGGGNSWSGSGGTHDLRMVVKDDGNVGIGGTLPSSPNISLKANGTADFASTVTFGGSVGTPNAAYITGTGDVVADRSAAASKTFYSLHNGTTKAYITAGGSASFDGTVSVANFNTPSSSTAGINLYDSGAVYVRRTDSSPIFRGYDGSTVKSEIGSDGSASFAESNVNIFASGATAINRATTSATDSICDFTSNIGGTKQLKHRFFADGSADVRCCK